MTKDIQNVIDCFKTVENDIDSFTKDLVSNDVLAAVRPHIERHGYKVERGKSNEEKIDVPVLFGQDNQIDKSFYADALSPDGKIVIEVETRLTNRSMQML